MTFDLQPELANDLVLVRPLERTDFEALYAVAKDPKIWALHQNPDRWKKEVFQTFFEEALAGKAAFAIIDGKTGNIIGSSRYRLSAKAANAIEIGWTFLSRTHWGGTYNKAFKDLMITHAFTHFDHVLFHVNGNNLRSQRAVRKLGGVLLERDGPLGHLCDLRENALTFCLHHPNHG
ncbi:MAG: GNAT family N-acetyltransferase [Bacteroidota bacterium]